MAGLKSLAMPAAVLLVAGTLAACGTTAGERGLSGAAIGAAAGAVGGATVGAPAVGAAIGGAVGGTVGALTDEANLNLGEPIWK